MYSLLFALALAQQTAPETPLEIDRDLPFPVTLAGRSVTGTKGPAISFDRDALFSGKEGIPLWELETFDLPIAGGSLFEGMHGEMRLNIMYWSHEWAGEEVLDGVEILEGTGFPAGPPGEGRFVLDLYGLDVSVSGMKASDGPLTLEVMVGLRVVQASFEMDGPSGREEETFGGLLAGMGLRCEWRPLSFLFAGGSVSRHAGFGPPLAEGMVAAGALIGPLRLEGGYRYLAINNDDGGDALRVSLRGPFFGVSVGF